MVTNPLPAIKNLDDVLVEQSTAGRPIKTFVGINTGRRTLSLIMSLFEVKEFTDVANDRSQNSLGISQRPLDLKHAFSIAKYVLKGLVNALEMKWRNQGVELPAVFEEIKSNLGTQTYFSIPPIVASLRSCKPNGTNLATLALETIDRETACYKVFLKHGDVLWIVDGQHRRKAVELIYEFLDSIIQNHKYPKNPALYKMPIEKEMTKDELDIWANCKEISKGCNITVEVHLGLNIEDEQQLFYDLNNYAKKVDRGLAFQFDGSNPVNQFVKEVLIDDKFEQADFTVFEKDKKNWQDDTAGITRKDLIAVHAVLFLNKTNINSATPTDVESKKELAEKFWDMILGIPGMSERGSKNKTVVAQPVVMKALAKLVYEFAWSKSADDNTKQFVEKLFNHIDQVDFSHKNPMWNYYNLPKEERTLRFGSLAEYLPYDEEGHSRDLGVYEGDIFKFGNKHNDIYPIIGDMIRWRLSLPSRRKVSPQVQMELAEN